jgi:hypothetical protein
LSNIVQSLHDFPNVAWGKNAAYPLIVQICEGALVKPSGIHDAAICQIVNDQVDEFDLVGGERSSRYETS